MNDELKRKHHKPYKNRICECGKCRVCRQRKYYHKYYYKYHDRMLERSRAYRLGPDIDEAKLNAYWEKVKDDDTKRISN